MHEPLAPSSGVLLTHGYFLDEDPKEKVIMKPYPPLGLLSISSFLEQNGIENSVFDSTFSSFEALCSELLLQKPGVLGIYTNLMTKINVLRIIRFVKQEPVLMHTKVVLGGPEVRNHAGKFLLHGADALVVGEGEESMMELVRLFQRTEKAEEHQKQFQLISGIAFRDEAGAVVVTPARSQLRDLDALPFPNRKKIRMENYFEAWKKRHGESALSVSTMRGCPYTCKWCSRAVYGQSYRRRSPAHVADELEALQAAYAFDTIWFVDDVFTISHRWLQGFRDELLHRGLKIRFECITRADRMNEEVIELLREAGCFRVWIGAESGSQKIIDAMDRRVDVQQVRTMIQKTRAAGLQAGTFIMIGYPGETEADIEETIEHLRSSDPDIYTITLAYPIKGTPLYEETESAFLTSFPWEESTDRDIDFRRTYPRRYYTHALRRIHNEIAFFRGRKNRDAGIAKLSFLKMKSLLSKAGMLLERSLH